MYQLRKVDESSSFVRAEDILGKVSEESLWGHYFGITNFGGTVSSPLRKDKRPSFSVYRAYSDGRIRFIDHKTGDRGDIFDLLSKYYNISFAEVLRRVSEDFRIISDNSTTKKPLAKMSVPKKKSSTFYQVISRPWSQPDLDYWAKFGVTGETLSKYDVYCVSRLFKNKELVYSYDKQNPCYVYYFPVTKRVKCYFPEAKKYGKIRFLSNTNNKEDVQGYYQCDVKGSGGGDKKILVLTKSMKDVMCLRGLGYDAMAIHGENHFFDIDFIRHIKKYYPVIVSIYDRDRTGLMAAKHLWKEYNIVPFFVGKVYNYLGIKDLSDMYEILGRGEVEKFMKRITTEIIK